MKVLYHLADGQERHAFLDAFRTQHGYKIGDKVGWFSGKDFATEDDVKRGRPYRDDIWNKIRFFSTFHISEENFISYWDALNLFSPAYLVGFPSSIFEICKIAKRKGLSLDKAVKVFFPTAEVILPYQREVIKDILGCDIFDQYASSEGAPFILECSEGVLHFQPLTGVIEVVDDNGLPATEGDLIVTSFTTRGTPLVRYQIGDRVTISNDPSPCPCGSSFPKVLRIDGRSTDYVYSTERGRVNSANLTNSTKGIEGIASFQVVQKVEREIVVKIVALPSFSVKQKQNFETALRERLGNNMLINFELLDEIPREPSGKFRVVKNIMKKRV